MYVPTTMTCLVWEGQVVVVVCGDRRMTEERRLTENMKTQYLKFNMRCRRNGIPLCFGGMTCKIKRQTHYNKVTHYTNDKWHIWELFEECYGDPMSPSNDDITRNSIMIHLPSLSTNNDHNITH